MNLSFRPMLGPPKPGPSMARTINEILRQWTGYTSWRLDNIPDILDSIAKFATRYASAQAVIAYTDRVVLEAVGKIVVTFGHRTHKDANTLFRPEIRYVVFNPNHICVIAERDLTAIGRQVIGDGILDDLEEFFLRICGSNGEPM